MRRLGSRVSFACGAVMLLALSPVPPAAAEHVHIDCGSGGSLCAEVDDSESSFGHYVGHDEPTVVFYSSRAGSGNRNAWFVTLPTDPALPANTNGVPSAGQSFNFQLFQLFWFGMAMCDTQSAPRPLGDPANPINPGLTCTPDSDTNIHENPSLTAPDSMSTHPGTAFMEMQFYPPGWALKPPGNNPGPISCSGTQWCAALNIDSLALDRYHGTFLNSTCQSQVGVETVNFAFITRSGVPHAPPSPVKATADTFIPNAATDLFMNSGDTVLVIIQDTAAGLRIDLIDLTSGQAGSMTASAANGFGQVLYDPSGSSCMNLPYDFHPMYSTSSEQTRVPWAIHAFNVGFDVEIGHFDYCSQVTASGGCQATEGAAGDLEPSDQDDNVCFGASASSLVKVSGCEDDNTGFDGTSYTTSWPDGSPLHPTPVVVTSGRTGPGFAFNYDRVAFEADLPHVEDPAVSPANACNRSTGVGCVNPPITDDGVSAAFYPFFTTNAGFGAPCAWGFGNDLPSHTISDFGGGSQYGALLQLNYLINGGLGTTQTRFNDFRQVLPTNPCPS
jgi:hypothetical protein